MIVTVRTPAHGVKDHAARLNAVGWRVIDDAGADDLVVVYWLTEESLGVALEPCLGGLNAGDLAPTLGGY